MTRSLSDIIKSHFVSFSDQKKPINIIDNKDPSILKSTGKSMIKEHEAGSESSVEGLSLNDLNLNPSLDSFRNEEQQQLVEKQKTIAKKNGYDEGFKIGKDEGYNEGHNEGYNEGIKKAETEVSIQLSKLDDDNQIRVKELKEQLINEYSDYKATLEPKMLTIIEDLVMKLIGEQSICKGVIVHLIKCGLDELEIHGDLVIKVSQEDLDYVIERKAELTEELSEKITVEILKDQQLSKNECVIETEMGTIESSLGVQLSGLLRELRLIKESLIDG